MADWRGCTIVTRATADGWPTGGDARATAGGWPTDGETLLSLARRPMDGRLNGGTQRSANSNKIDAALSHTLKTSQQHVDHDDSVSSLRHSRSVR